MEEEVNPEISLNLMVGITSPKTFKLRGEVNRISVVVMIDWGATHDFIAMQVVQELGVNCTNSKNFGVSLGTGETVQSQGECQSVVLQLHGLTIVENFMPIKLGNFDLNMGLQWLEKLGTMMTYWKSQTIKFRMGDEMVTLKGDASLGRTGITLKAMIKTMRKEKSGFLVEFNYLGVNCEEKQGEEETSEVPLFFTPVIQ